jgi:hypothetical protein
MRNFKLRHLFCYLLLVAAVATGISFSRFSTTITNFGAENTEPEIEFSTWVLEQGTEPISLQKMVPGASRTIRIWVRNWKNDGGELKVSDYHQSFRLELETTGNLPLEFTLKESGGEGVGFPRHGSTSYLSESLAFTAQEKETKKLALTVSWPEGSKDEFYKHEIDYLELSIRAVQSRPD